MKTNFFVAGFLIAFCISCTCKPPVASFSVNPIIGNTDTIFVFNAGASYDDKTETNDLQFRWDWESDGQWDKDYSNEQTATHKFNAAGVYNVKLEVMNECDKMDQATFALTVTAANRAPIAVIKNTPETGTIYTEFTFDASQSTDTETPFSELLVRWDWGNDGTWDTDFTTAKTAKHKYGIAGTYTVKLEVKDGGGLVGTATKSIPVGDNTKPNAVFEISPTGGTISTDFNFNASASSDAETPADLLLVRWDWENDGNWDTQYSADKTTTHKYTQVGTYTVKLEVKDDLGLVGTATGTVQVGNTEPKASFTITPMIGYLNTDFKFDASTSSDLETPAAQLEVRWDWENDGTWDTQYSTDQKPSHKYSQAGTYTVKLEVRDEGGLHGTVTKNVQVKVNTSPTASFTINPSGGDNKTVFSFDASASSDLETPAAQLEVRWDWENDGIWDTPYSTNRTATHKYSQDGTYTIKLEVKDGEGLTGSITKTVIVITTNPPKASFSVTPTEGYIQTNFSFDASGSSDLETPLAQLQFRWDWENDGTWDTGYSTKNDNTHQYSEAGTFTVRLEVKDESGLVGTVTKNVLVKANTPPIAVITISPATGTIETTYTFSADNSDDLETLRPNLQVKWDLGDGTQTQYSNSKSITHTYVRAGDKKIGLEVKDEGGLTDIAETILTVRPVVPKAITSNIDITKIIFDENDKAFKVPVGGEVTDDGGEPIKERGICWNNEKNPTPDNWKQSSTPFETGSFICEIKGLSPITTYYVRAYAINNAGTAYGDEEEITTPEAFEGYYIDFRDTTVYTYRKIGAQNWMVENLAWLPAVMNPGLGSNASPFYYVYDYGGFNVSVAKSQSNYKIYGVLYNWEAAKISCPSGWHLPSDEEWTTLTNYLINRGFGYGGSGPDIGKSMASTSGWTAVSTPGRIGCNQETNNSSGFNARPGGYRIDNEYGMGFFGQLNEQASFWSSASLSLDPYLFLLSNNSDHATLTIATNDRSHGNSIRCIKDN